LSRVSASWKTDVGADTAIDWPTGIGAKGNEGVAGNVAQISGAIGYVEYAYAKQNHLAHVKMANKAGQVVEPTVEAFRAAASNANWTGCQGQFLLSWWTSPAPSLADHGNHLHPGLRSAGSEGDPGHLKFFSGALEGRSAGAGPGPCSAAGAAVKSIEASWKKSRARECDFRPAADWKRRPARPPFLYVAGI
jgi:hypothetical protein